MPMSRETLETLYQVMVRIRRFDEKTAELFLSGHVKGTAHSYVGQEAVAAAACAHLTRDDSVISNHRGHGHCIAKGARLDLMMAELMGREDGYCRGLRGLPHISPPPPHHSRGECVRRPRPEHSGSEWYRRRGRAHWRRRRPCQQAPQVGPRGRVLLRRRGGEPG